MHHWIERNVLSFAVCGSSIVTGIFCTDLCRPLTLCWEFEVAAEVQRHRWGVFTSTDLPEEFSLCLLVFIAPIHTIILQNGPRSLKFLIPKGIYFIPSESSESVKGLKRPSSGIPFFSPCPLNLSMGSESHFHPIHAIPSSAPWALLLCHATSQDILKLDMDDVYLLINLCSKNNGMTGNCQGSAGSGQVGDITFSPDNRNSIT